MKAYYINLMLTVLVAISLLGCSSYRDALFTTKTNVGFDADTKPPTAEVSIARREGVIEPSFGRGGTPPVIASFRLDSGWWIFAQISSTFAGGDAALTMAKLYSTHSRDANSKTNSQEYDSTLILSNATRIPGLMYTNLFGTKKFKGLYSEDEVSPLMFGTDTALGLKTVWSGLSLWPDTVKLGFNRKEFALAPVFGVHETNVENNSSVHIKIASFLATIENKLEYETNSAPAGSSRVNSKAHHIQYFATGKAADFLARQDAVRNMMIRRFDPQAAQEQESGARTNAMYAIALLYRLDESKTAVLLTSAVDSGVISEKEKSDFSARMANKDQINLIKEELLRKLTGADVHDLIRFVAAMKALLLVPTIEAVGRNKQ